MLGNGAQTTECRKFGSRPKSELRNKIIKTEKLMEIKKSKNFYEGSLASGIQLRLSLAWKSEEQ